jgi:hypothetical protein
MGIPHLTTKLQPYSRRCCLGTEGAKEHSIALIDGPNLVYHIYGTLVGILRASEEIHTMVSYETVWKATRKWLDDLKIFGYDM